MHVVLGSDDRVAQVSRTQVVDSLLWSILDLELLSTHIRYNFSSFVHCLHPSGQCNVLRHLSMDWTNRWADYCSAYHIDSTTRRYRRKHKKNPQINEKQPLSEVDPERYQNNILLISFTNIWMWESSMRAHIGPKTKSCWVTNQWEPMTKIKSL